LRILLSCRKFAPTCWIICHKCWILWNCLGL
jgi:hypothetical protein